MQAALWEGIAEKHLLSNQVDELVAKVIKLERQVQCGAGREGRLAAQLQEQARQAADSRAALVKQLETQEGIHQVHGAHFCWVTQRYHA